MKPWSQRESLFLSSPEKSESADNAKSVCPTYRPSVFLRYAAHCIEDGRPVDRLLAPPGWTNWICQTLPPYEEWDEQELTETRVMRFLLAAELAEQEGC